MLSKRILLFSILFLVLAISLFHYVLPNVLYPLRVDAVPAGAYVVPWMRPSPSIRELPETFDIDAVMIHALKLSMTFRIDTPNSTRVIPSTVYLSHDSDYLYVGGKFVGMGSNPASIPYGDTEPNVFKIYFDVDNSGVLKSPESGSGLGVNIDVPQETLVAGSFADLVWEHNPYSTTKYMTWMCADLYLGPKGQTIFSMAANAIEYDKPTGTITILFARFLSRPGIVDINALQMRPGERWVMGFLLELEYQLELANMVDGWPRNIYPWLSNDSSWWPKLVIDLTNPPPAYSGTPASQQSVLGVERRRNSPYTNDAVPVFSEWSRSVLHS